MAQTNWAARKTQPLSYWATYLSHDPHLRTLLVASFRSLLLLWVTPRIYVSNPNEIPWLTKLNFGGIPTLVSHWFHIWDVVPVFAGIQSHNGAWEEEECKSQRVGKNIVKCCLLDRKRQSHPWTHNSYGYLCARPSWQDQSTFPQGNTNCTQWPLKKKGENKMWVGTVGGTYGSWSL